MNNYDIFTALGDIDGELLSPGQTPKPRRPGPALFAGLAACLCLAAAAILWTARPGPEEPDSSLDNRASPVPATAEPTAPPETRPPEAYPEISFNDLSGVPLASTQPDVGYFMLLGEALNAQELSEVSPFVPRIDLSAGPKCGPGVRYYFSSSGEPLDSGGDSAPADWELLVTGSAQYLGDGTLDHVHLDISTESGNLVYVKLRPDGPSDLIAPLPEGEYVETRFGGLDFTAYSDVDESGYGRLWTEFRLGDVRCLASADVSPGTLDIAREALQTVMAGYARRGGAPDLGIFSMRETHIWRDEELDLADARLDPDFGAFLPSETPSGFSLDRVRRHADDSSDYLSAFWYGYYSDLSWTVRYYSPADELRLTTLDQTGNYDLSLYPIPRGESVPEELRQIVDDPVFDMAELTPQAVWARAYTVQDAGDTGGWRGRFSVRAGDILISISFKGLDPDWVYSQLDAMR